MLPIDQRLFIARSVTNKKFIKYVLNLYCIHYGHNPIHWSFFLYQSDGSRHYETKSCHFDYLGPGASYRHVASVESGRRTFDIASFYGGFQPNPSTHRFFYYKKWLLAYYETRYCLWNFSSLFFILMDYDEQFLNLNIIRHIK